MPRCKNCGQVINSIDKDICPFCGELKPLDSEESYKTQDITQFVKISKDENNPVTLQLKKRKNYILFSFLLGFLGINFFYLGKKVLGYFFLGVFALFTIVLLIIGLVNSFTPLLPYLLIESIYIAAINIGLGVYSILNKNEKDAFKGRLA